MRQITLSDGTTIDAADRYEPVHPNIVVNAIPSFETSNNPTLMTAALAGAWSPNIGPITGTNVELDPEQPFLTFEFAVVETIYEVSIQGLDSCIAPDPTAPTVLTTDCGSVAEWFITYYNGKTMLGLDTNGKPFEVTQTTPESMFKKTTCGTDRIALCTLDLSNYPIYAKSLTIHITRVNENHPFMRVAILAEGNPYLNAVNGGINNNEKIVVKHVEKTYEPPEVEHRVVRTVMPSPPPIVNEYWGDLPYDYF